MGKVASFFKGSGTLVVLVLSGLGVWSAKEWLGIPDTAILVGLIYVSYLAARFDAFGLQERLDDLESDFRLYREETDSDISRLDRQSKITCEDIDTLHPDGKSRHVKRMGLGGIFEDLEKEV